MIYTLRSREELKTLLFTLQTLVVKSPDEYYSLNSGGEYTGTRNLAIPFLNMRSLSRGVRLDESRFYRESNSIQSPLEEDDFEDSHLQQYDRQIIELLTDCITLPYPCLMYVGFDEDGLVDDVEVTEEEMSHHVDIDMSKIFWMRSGNLTIDELIKSLEGKDGDSIVEYADVPYHDMMCYNQPMSPKMTHQEKIPYSQLRDMLQEDKKQFEEVTWQDCTARIVTHEGNNIVHPVVVSWNCKRLGGVYTVAYLERSSEESSQSS